MTTIKMTVAAFILTVAGLNASPGYYRSFTVASGQITGTLTNLPVVVKITDPTLATTTNGGRVQNANGYDIRFWSDVGLTVTLAHEMERYNAATGEVIAWVNCASCTVGTVIYMSYGDPTITTSQQNTTGVWDTNHRFVGHLPNGTTLTINDSTSNTNNLSFSTGGTAAASAGQLGGAANLTGGANLWKNANPVSLQATAAWTLSAWIKIADYTGYKTVISKAGSFDATYAMDVSDTGKLRGYLSQGSFNYLTAASTSNVPTGSFVYATATWDGATIRTYINGVSDGPGQAATGAADNVGAFMAIGSTNPAGSPSNTFTGDVDEARVSNIARSASWIAAEYNNQRTSSTFFTVGSEQSTVTGPVPVLGWGTSQNGYSWDGPKTVIAGYQSLYAFYNMRWAVNVTCANATDRCDSGSGYTPTGSEGTVYFSSTANSPSYVVPPSTPGTPLGLITMYGNVLASYNICNVSGTTFQLGRAGCGTIQTFADDGTGTLSILIPRAAHAYITSMTTADGGTTYTTTAGTMPAGTTYKWYLGDSGGITGTARVSALNHLFSYNSNDQLLLGVNVPSTATPGAYTMSLVVCPNDDGTGSCGTLSWVINVAAPPNLPLNVEPASFPAITGLAAWETQMTSASGGAAQWCTKATGVTNPSTIDFTSHVAYYDGFRIFRQIANYTGDAQWNNCSDYMLPQYLSTYIVPNNGNIQGIDVFPDGLTHALNTQSRYAMAMEKMGFVNGQSGVTYILYGGLARANWMREVSYAMNWMNARVKMQGYPIAAKHKLTADALVSMLLSAVDGSGRAGYQTFITSLALEALIKWWQITHDPRVPYVVKLVIDDWWLHWDNTTTFSFEYNVAVDGPYCNLGATWFQSDIAGHCAGDHVNQNILNGLMVAPFGWYWRLSGDSTYQTRGDTVFSHLMSSAPFTGKEFSQNYRQTFDYVGWRTGRLSPEHNSLW